jgi:hypothetical protein
LKKGFRLQRPFGGRKNTDNPFSESCYRDVFHTALNGELMVYEDQYQDDGNCEARPRKTDKGADDKAGDYIRPKNLHDVLVSLGYTKENVDHVMVSGIVKYRCVFKAIANLLHLGYSVKTRETLLDGSSENHQNWKPANCLGKEKPNAPPADCVSQDGKNTACAKDSTEAKAWLEGIYGKWCGNDYKGGPGLEIKVTSALCLFFLFALIARMSQPCDTR